MPSVDAEATEIITRSTVWQKVSHVIERRSPVPDPCFQNRTDRIPNALDLGVGQQSDRSCRMDAGSMKDLIGVDVSQSGDETLIEQCRFDRRNAIGEMLDELVGRWKVVERITADPIESGRIQFLRCEDRDEPERPRIDESQLDVRVRRQQRVGVCRFRLTGRRDLHAAGHSEMEHQREVFDVGDDELPPPGDDADGPSSQPFADVGGANVPPGGAIPSYLCTFDGRSGEHRRDEPSRRFHFGQLGHDRSFQCLRSNAKSLVLRPHPRLGAKSMTSRPDLRPRSIGENLDAGFKLFTANFKQLILVAATILVPVAVVNGVIGASAGNVNYLDLVVDPENLDSLEGFGTIIAVSVLTGVISALASLVVQAAAVGVIGEAYQGRPTEWRSALGVGLRKFFPVLMTGILVGILAITLAIAVAIIVFIMAQFSTALAIATAIFGFIGLIVSIYTLAYVSVPALVVEDLGPVQAIRRSFELVRKRFWPTFWTAALAAIIVGIIAAIVSSIIQLAVAGPAIFSASESGELSGGLLFAVSAVSSALVGIFQTPFLAAIGLAIYFDLRVRLEGFDLEMLARELDDIDTPAPHIEDESDPFGLDSPE